MAFWKRTVWTEDEVRKRIAAGDEAGTTTLNLYRFFGSGLGVGGDIDAKGLLAQLQQELQQISADIVAGVR